MTENAEKPQVPHADPNDLSWLEDALTPKEVAEILGITYHHLLKKIHRGEITAYRIGSRKIRIPRTALAQVIAPVESSEGSAA